MDEKSTVFRMSVGSERKKHYSERNAQEQP